MKGIILVTLVFLFSGVNAQNVNIPDANFKAYLLANPSINTNGDSEIQIIEANVCTVSLTCPGLDISDLTGIETFTAIPYLQCANNNLTSLDVSSNSALIYLYCASNQLTSLDVTNNVNLVGLSVAFNSLSSLDLSQNNALTTLNFKVNHLSTLDLSGNLNLENINAASNELTSLNVANGNNVNFIVFSTLDNPELECIQVDAPNYSTLNWVSSFFKFDANHSFDDNCYVGLNEGSLNLDMTIYPNPSSNQITLKTEQGIDKVSIFNMQGTLVMTPSSKTFSIESLTNGVYVVEINSDSHLLYGRLVKE